MRIKTDKLTTHPLGQIPQEIAEEKAGWTIRCGVADCQTIFDRLGRESLSVNNGSPNRWQDTRTKRRRIYLLRESDL